MRKKLLSILALLCLTASSAWAAPTVLASGTSKDVAWTLTDDGVMTISGTGYMEDYIGADYTPWSSLATYINSVVIENGVKSIGMFAFSECILLESVTMGNDVKFIGDNAFESCTSLTSVTIPASVTLIYNYAFAYCSNLATVTLNSNPEIFSGAFYSSPVTVTMNLTANSADGAKWTTFYNKSYHFVADANTQVFKVGLSGTTITLKKVSDRIVNASTGVVLKTTGGGNPVMTLTTSSSGNIDTNNLEGVSNAEGKTSDGTMFVLNYKAATGVGFYRLKSGKNLGVGKAYLTYSGALAPEFLGFENDVTAIEDVVKSQEQTADSQYFNLNGQRVAQPTKGLYIVNGKKVIIK